MHLVYVTNSATFRSLTNVVFARQTCHVVASVTKFLVMYFCSDKSTRFKFERGGGTIFVEEEYVTMVLLL
jgi:hypothetical protein